MTENLDAEPDYRFTLANERTFLAYVRTALALNGAGLAVVQFLTIVGNQGRVVVGVALVLSGLATTLAGFQRWRSVQSAMRASRPLPSSSVPFILTIVLVVASLVAAGALVLVRP